ncbi:MAG: magnesium/cobalt transporter CorA [Spirochaetes bacterium]|nr:magnesium/cobalt transporter CorA [Spirochaetota bacterium]
MNKSTPRISGQAGLLPGTVIHIGEKKLEKAIITLIDYNEKEFQEKKVESVEKCYPFRDKPTVTWINIDGLHQTEVIEKICNNFKVHPLTIEDIVNTSQRPKMEAFDDYLFIVLKMLTYDRKKKKIDVEQISFILGETYLITFQEKSGDVFENIRDRIRTAKGRVRKMKVDYLVYSLIDAIVDSCFSLLEEIGESIEKTEENLILDPAPDTLMVIKNLKKEMILLRKSVWPLREVLHNLTRAEHSYIHASTEVYLRDVYDHTIQVIDTIESYRDMLSGLLDIYLSSMSHKMNEVMKVLTMIATIFIPLTFIVGVYGMNFEFMPEIKWKWGYFAIWGFMILVFGGMLAYFKRKKWL